MDKSRTIWFYVPPRVHMLDLAGPIQVFYEANTYGARYDLQYFTTTEHPTSSAGLPFGQIRQFNLVVPSAGDYIFVPGAEMEFLYSNELRQNVGFLSWLMTMPGRGVFVCSICTGAFILAGSGLLNNKRCTTHWKRIPELQTTYPNVIVEENILYTHDEQVYTSAGITSGIDLSLAIIEEHYGPMFTHKVARELLVYHRRSSNHGQHSVYLDYRNHLNVGIHVVQDWLIENLHQKTTIDKLAAMANMSSRNFTRLFRKSAGITVNEYMRRLRVEKAQTLQNNPILSSEDIASQIGYTNSRQLRRIKKKGKPK
ncbi:MAG: DJ-1/PfpI family protein [Bacteroidota bacterium]|nr:DJ-1/PfpI family protein [Bacteroidota bacterium]MDP4216635.1 DJ-1/PfpI family protein [Bacteroidota bacterium]MDP4245749.1 DJ-1/PfpI family protein [Bacteroidota bacterium]MDP4256487.1 DJ-1/PfpI family protein [Bacteroidota bacterium]MDP4260770.1 DJ-1/PfpI family protein [Bacteroidota bacterium]